VEAHCRLGDAEQICDLLVAPAIGEKGEAIPLAVAEGEDIILEPAGEFHQPFRQDQAGHLHRPRRVGIDPALAEAEMQ